jgi:two-component system, NtrC family, nitrogen regulation sensor histidine kinase NtrY
MYQEQKSNSIWRRYLPIALLGIFVLGLLTFLVLLQSSQIWRIFQVETASDTLTLYALTSLNFFALVIFGFIFFRSVLKLVRERRSLILGAKLKTRLLVYFVAVSLLPIAAMATFSYLFLNRATEKWFSRLPETVIAEAKRVQKNALDEQVSKFNEKAGLLAAAVETTPLEEPKLRVLLERGNLSALEVAAPNGVIMARVERELESEQRQILRETWEKVRQSSVSDNSLQDGVGFDAAAITLADGRILRVVSSWRNEAVFSQEILNSGEEFEFLKEQQGEVRQLGFSVLSLLTFLLVFASSWVAFHLGRSLTQPIRALAEASNEVSRGNLAHRVQVLAEDELALLVDSFNQMTGQLDENRQRLEERRNYIETVLQSLSTGVISLDENNRVTTINDAATEMLRLNDSVTDNVLLSEILREEDRLIVEKLLARARRVGQAAEQTVLLRHNSNGVSDESLPVALTATALQQKSANNKRGVVLVIEDLSELLTAQRTAAWQEVARRMAHEIKNPLTPIQLSAERIAKRFNSNGEQKPQTKEQVAKVVDEGTSTILREVSSLKAMVDEFSQFARLPHAKLEPNDLNEIVRQAITLYEDRLDGVQIVTELAENLPVTMLDAEQLRRVFVNLIDNSIEAFGAEQIDKKITITTRLDNERDLLIAAVSDNGRGIPAANLNKLFQPYFSTKGRGTGLGLAIVQRIISEHGGRIRTVRNLLRGAKFVIELPL